MRKCTSSSKIWRCRSITSGRQSLRMPSFLGLSSTRPAAISSPRIDPCCLYCRRALSVRRGRWCCWAGMRRLVDRYRYRGTHQRHSIRNPKRGYRVLPEGICMDMGTGMGMGVGGVVGARKDATSQPSPWETHSAGTPSGRLTRDRECEP